MLLGYQNKFPTLGREVFIAETAAVVGDVTVRDNSSVWFGAAVRGDEAAVTVGSGTNIQDNATLHCDPGHPLTVGNNVTVGHNAVVHCKSVGDDTIIGMGALLLTGAQIGSGCIIAAGAVVLENTVIPDGALAAGVPARVIRQVSPEYAAYLKKESLYVPLAKEYLHEGQN